MEGKKLSKALMVIYGVFGIGTGLIFGRAQYYKGQADAYEDITEDLQKVSKNIEETLKDKEEA